MTTIDNNWTCKDNLPLLGWRWMTNISTNANGIFEQVRHRIDIDGHVDTAQLDVYLLQYVRSNGLIETEHILLSHA